jgi:hypothetical protein
MMNGPIGSGAGPGPYGPPGPGMGPPNMNNVNSIFFILFSIIVLNKQIL